MKISMHFIIIFMDKLFSFKVNQYGVNIIFKRGDVLYDFYRPFKQDLKELRCIFFQVELI